MWFTGKHNWQLAHNIALTYIDNCPTRCNTKQSIYYSASSLYMFRVSNIPIIRSTQNCNYSLRYRSYPRRRQVAAQKSTWPRRRQVAVQKSTWPRRRQVATQKSTWPRRRQVAAQKIWPVLEAVVTVLRTPDDGCGWHPKHVEWTCRIINRLLCVASRWTIINIDQRCTKP
jgi:hypothetical protein